MPTSEQIMKENPELYCPACKVRMRATRISGYKNMFCRKCYKIWTNEEIKKELNIK